MSSALERRWFESVAGIEDCVLCGAHGTQVSHSNMLRGHGQKSAPWDTAALCVHCHHEIDNGPLLSRTTRREMHFEAITKTHAALIRAGRLVLK